jgi:hypothetical protein
VQGNELAVLNVENRMSGNEGAKQRVFPMFHSGAVGNLNPNLEDTIQGFCHRDIDGAGH